LLPGNHHKKERNTKTQSAPSPKAQVSKPITIYSQYFVMLVQSLPQAIHTASDLITSLACMIQTCTCARERETGRGEERKDDENKKKGRNKEKKCDNSSLVGNDTAQSGRNVVRVICRRLCSLRQHHESSNLW